MSDVIVGAVIGLLASLLTTVVIKWMEWRRERAVRWDKDILAVATGALISAERAKGRIHAWAQGELGEMSNGARPELVESAIDQCYYSMKSLVILFPDCGPDIRQLQAVIVELAGLTKDLRAGSLAATAYADRAGQLRAEVDHLGEKVLGAVQSRLHVEG